MHDPAPSDHPTPAAPVAPHELRHLGPAARAELRHLGPAARAELRRDLVAQAYKIRQEHPDLTIADIARRLGRSPSTVAKYFTDPTATKARERKHAYRGICATEGCENPTSAGDGRGRAREHCRNCENASRRVHTENNVIEILRRFEAETGRRARSSDFHPTRAHHAGGETWERYQRFGLALATIRRVFTGGFPAAAAAAYGTVAARDTPAQPTDWHAECPEDGTAHHGAPPDQRDVPSGHDEVA
jgi:AraC-like DNA-binding protein